METFTILIETTRLELFINIIIYFIGVWVCIKYITMYIWDISWIKIFKYHNKKYLKFLRKTKLKDEYPSVLLYTKNVKINVILSSIWKILYFNKNKIKIKRQIPFKRRDNL